jgi:hypothetical protein
MNESEMINAIEEGVFETLKNLRTDCPFCKEQTEIYLRKQINAFLALTDPLDALQFMLNFNWDCPFCEKNVKPKDVLPLSPEEAEVKKYQDMGHTVVWHMEYDAFLNYTLEKKVGVENCEDKNCEFCTQEIDWKRIKEEYE